MPFHELEAFLQGWNVPTGRRHPTPVGQRHHYSIDLPRRVHIFWDKGFDDAPDIVKLCVQSWQSLNPGWKIVLLDQEHADRIIPRRTFPEQMKIAHYADMLRIAILKDVGGVWADASCLCLKPLDNWLPNIFNQCAFFAFHKPGPDRLISNWFLAASRDSVLVQEMYAIFRAYWNWGPYRGGRPPYFWFHYLFEHLVKNDTVLKAHWTRVPKLSAVPVHQLKRVMSKTIEDNDAFRDRIKVSPVQKLTHKQDIRAEDVLALLDELAIQLHR